ncbi:hypothetical protein GON26_13450 [Flavobacterium sp. GA093]|uniref:Uncharacterized protein n=1 Tax=Flavobacterium hydrocarbonoxydans TaxID=2683249 RepID=A0A6I4NUK0_9FLAO|nr:hypothetical protein [Flavobacterium hydrocarbonoxydans]MWB95369.1 hypothetical protein [Flavobacterium hydrocarbonoxydans]
MKEVIIKLSFCLAFLISSVSFAQGLNKKSLLSELNKTEGVTLDAKQKSSYEKANADLATGLLNLDKKSVSKTERDSKIDGLFSKRDKDLKSSLGNDKFLDLNKKTSKNIKQLQRKVKLAKLVL